MIRRVFTVGMAGLIALSGCEKKDAAGQGANVDEMTAADAPQVQNWPLFRGGAEMQGVSKEDLKAPLELAWSFEPPLATEAEKKAAEAAGRKPVLPTKRYPIEASPVIADGMVFVGGQDSRFFAIDLKMGTGRWTFTAEGPISAPGAVFGDRVFFGDAYGFVYGLDTATGEEKWRYETGGKIQGGVNALDVDGKLTLFVGSEDNSLYALDAATGEKLWAHETANLIVSTPSIVASKLAVIFGGCDGVLHVVPASGKGRAGEVEIGTYIANTSPVSDGMAYIADNSGNITAVDMESGETAWKIATQNEFIASPAVNAEMLVIGGPDKRLVAYDRMTGEEVWAFQARRSIESSAVICESAIWFGGKDARVYALDPANGEELWSYDLGAQVKASPAISAQTLVICGDDGVVYAFRPAK